MKLDEPCGFCGKPLEHGDSFHTLWVKEGDASGKEPGKYNNACSKCAGFPSSATPIPPGANMHKDQWCACCMNIMPKSAEYRRLRIMECDDCGLEPGLHAMCGNCYDKHLPLVQKRVAKKYKVSEWPKPTETVFDGPDDEIGTETEIDDGKTPHERYDNYVSHLAGHAVM